MAFILNLNFHYALTSYSLNMKLRCVIIIICWRKRKEWGNVGNGGDVKLRLVIAPTQNCFRLFRLSCLAVSTGAK